MVENKIVVSLYDKHVVQGESWDWNSTVQLFSAGLFATTMVVLAKGLKGDVGNFSNTVGNKETELFLPDEYYQNLNKNLQYGYQTPNTKEIYNRLGNTTKGDYHISEMRYFIDKNTGRMRLGKANNDGTYSWWE